MKAAYEIFGKAAFRKYYGPRNRLLPINKAIFETWSVNLGDLPDEQIQSLIEAKEQIKEKFAILMMDSVFDNSVSQGTGDLKKVHYRFQKVKALLCNQPNYD